MGKLGTLERCSELGISGPPRLDTEQAPGFQLVRSRWEAVEVEHPADSFVLEVRLGRGVVRHCHRSQRVVARLQLCVDCPLPFSAASTPCGFL